MKILICIFEGVSNEALDFYISQKELPNFEYMFSSFPHGKLECNKVPYEAAGITTAFSGIDSIENGIVSYWKAKNYNYIPEEWKSENIKEYMFWNKEKYSNNNITLVNLFGTQPPYAVNGNMLSYSMEKNLRFSYPKELLLNLNKHKIPYVQDTCAFFTPSTDKDSFCDEVIRIDQLRKNAFINLINGYTDIGIVNFTCIDRVSHFCYDEIDEPLKEKSRLLRAYKNCDEILKDMIALADNYNSKLLVFSEIGFGKLKKFIRVNEYLERCGLLSFDKQNNIVDYKKSIAFESVQGTHGVNINLEGEFKNGIVNKSEYAQILKQIVDALKDMENPVTGLPMFKRILATCKYVNYSKKLPDIIMEPYSWEYLPYGDPYWANHVSRDCQTGWHRPESFWAFQDGNLQNGRKELRDIYTMIVDSI